MKYRHKYPLKTQTDINPSCHLSNDKNIVYKKKLKNRQQDQNLKKYICIGLYRLEKIRIHYDIPKDTKRLFPTNKSLETIFSEKLFVRITAEVIKYFFALA